MTTRGRRVMSHLLANALFAVLVYSLYVQVFVVIFVICNDAHLSEASLCYVTLYPNME